MFFILLNSQKLDQTLQQSHFKPPFSKSWDHKSPACGTWASAVMSICLESTNSIVTSYSCKWASSVSWKRWPSLTRNTWSLYYNPPLLQPLYRLSYLTPTFLLIVCLLSFIISYSFLTSVYHTLFSTRKGMNYVDPVSEMSCRGSWHQQKEEFPLLLSLYLVTQLD